MGGTSSTHGGKLEMYVQFYSGNLKGRCNERDVGIDWKIILKWVLEIWGMGMWTELNLLSMGSNGEL
jgi:hypothetical protein